MSFSAPTGFPSARQLKIITVLTSRIVYHDELCRRYSAACMTVVITGVFCDDSNQEPLHVVAVDSSFLIRRESSVLSAAPATAAAPVLLSERLKTLRRKLLDGPLEPKPPVRWLRSSNSWRSSQI